jgi:uncharacterized membrane protein (UPF0127 family)
MSDEHEIEQGSAFRPKFDAQGLLTAVAVDSASREVLMVAFMDADGVIINIEDMQPQTENNHCARKPARYALEMNLGWFAKRGFKAGARLTGAPFTQATK